VAIVEFEGLDFGVKDDDSESSLGSLDFEGLDFGLKDDDSESSLDFLDFEEGIGEYRREFIASVLLLVDFEC